VKRLSVASFRRTVLSIREDVEVTAYGRVIGRWSPSVWQIATSVDAPGSVQAEGPSPNDRRATRRVPR
jgi:hypothetical protein